MDGAERARANFRICALLELKEMELTGAEAVAVLEIDALQRQTVHMRNFFVRPSYAAEARPATHSYHTLSLIHI